MRLKLTVLLLLTVTIFSCKRELVSYKTAPIKEAIPACTEDKSTPYEPPAAGAATSAPKTSQPIIEEVVEEKKEEGKTLKEAKQTKHLGLSKTKTIDKKIERAKKEMNPRLSRALWMMIPGGLAVILGILLYGVAPTGLFIFAFSIVFLVGLVSLILYLANPKPKM